MTVDVNAYNSTTGVTEGAIPLIYGQNVIEALYDAEKLRPLGEDVSFLVRGAGNQLQIPTEDAQYEVGKLTEGVSTPISTLDFGKKTLTFNWYGDAKQWTIDVEKYAFPYLLNSRRENAAKALGVNRDIQIITELLTTSTSALYPFKADGTKYTSGTMDANATFQYEQITGADTYMLEANLAVKNVLVHPRNRLALLRDSRFISNNNYNKQVMESGRIKTVDGVDVIVHNGIQTTTENSMTVYIALALSDKAFYYAQKQEPVYELDRINILDRAWTFHYFEAFGVLLKRNAGIVPLKAVGATL